MKTKKLLQVILLLCFCCLTNVWCQTPPPFVQNTILNVGTVPSTSTTSASQNSVYVGNGAGANLDLSTNNQINYSNVFVGINSGFTSNTSQVENSRNTYLGYGTGLKSVGSDNIFIGHLAGNLNTTGYENIMIKPIRQQVTFNDITGFHNTMIGYQTGDNLTSGINNCFYGMSSGAGNLSGNRNLFMGFEGGALSTVGSDNVSLSSAGPSAGDGNVLIGVGAGNNVATSRNVVIGDHAGGVLTNGSGSNLLLGQSSGYTLVNGSSNVMVGALAGEQLTSGSGNVFLGSVTVPPGVSTPTALGNDTNNAVVLADGAGHQRLIVEGINGYAGMGLVNNMIPKNRLELAGGLTGTSGLRFTNYTSSVVPSTTATKFLTVNASGDVLLQNLPPGNGTTTNTLVNPLNLMISTVNGVSSSAPVITAVGLGSANNQLTLSINGISTPPLQLTQVIGGTNVTVGGDGSAGNPYVINANTGSSSGEMCNIYNSDGTINTYDTHVCSNPNPGLRTVTMGKNNLLFQTPDPKEHSQFGKVYIGSRVNFANTNGDYRLYVEGGVLTEKVKVSLRFDPSLGFPNDNANWQDYVFSSRYKLMPLSEVESYVNCNRHLPGIESAEELERDGLDLGAMQAKQMGKIEELTLYAIEQDKKLEQQSKEIEQLKAQMKILLEKSK